MKILVAVTASTSYGLVRGQLKYFSSKGNDVYLLSGNSPGLQDDVQAEGATHVPVRMQREISPIHDGISLFCIIRRFSQLDLDIVNAGTPKAGLLCVIAARLCRVPKVVYTCRGLRYEHESGLLRYVLKLTERICGALAHTVICISPSVKNKAIADRVFRKSKCVVIGRGSSNGIDIDYFHPDHVSGSVTQTIKTDLCLQGAFVFGFVGRLSDRKGINELVWAFETIAQRTPRVKLLLVGSEEPGQLANRSQLMSAIHSNPNIVWVGYQTRDQVRAFYSVFDLLILPAWWEGFGNVLVEAAAMGIPVLSTYATGTVDAVDDGNNGTLVPVNDENELTEAMLRYKDDPELVKKHGEYGRLWAENFSNMAIWHGLAEVLTLNAKAGEDSR